MIATDALCGASTAIRMKPGAKSRAGARDGSGATGGVGEGGGYFVSLQTGLL